MIPLRDSVRSNRIPFVNYLIILACGVIFLYEIMLGERVAPFLYRFGVIPFNVGMVLSGGEMAFSPLVSLFTSMFLHGGWMHLIGNMLYLYIFGDNVEDKLGHMGYLLFYVLCGAGASLAEVYMRPESTAPLIGASGAIAGVLGAYFLLFPRARVLTLVPLFVFFPVIEVSAFFFLGFWFIMQFLQGSLSYGADVSGGVAWWAHAGGFVAGAVMLPVFLLVRRL